MRILLLSIFCLSFVTFTFGQPQEITEDESVQELVKAFGKFSENSWRKKQNTENFRNGKLINVTEVIEEKEQPDKRRIKTTEKKGKVIISSEIIAIGETYYCKKGKNAWRISIDWCNEPIGFRGMGDQVSSNYTVEETKYTNQNGKLYRQYISYNDEKGLYYWDYKFWISDEGFILKREIETGLVKTKEILSRMTEISEINPKDLKIEAPIK